MVKNLIRLEKTVRSIIVFIILVSLSGMTTKVYAQYMKGQNYTVSQFGLDEGLPQSSVNDIIQTRDGYIWLATFGGLVRFDGNTFTTFDRSNTEGLRTDRILKIYEGVDEDIWLFPETSNTFLYRFKEGKSEVFKIRDEIVGAISLYTDQDDRLWLTGFGSIYRFDNNEFVKAVVKNDSESRDKALQDQRGAWLLDSNKLFKTTEDIVVEIRDLRDTGIEGFTDVRELSAGSGHLLLGSVADGILEIKDGQDRYYNESNGLAANEFLNFYKGEQSLFASLYGKMVYWNGQEFENVELLKNQGAYFPRSILEDSEGNLWIGTSGNGLFRIRRSVISMIDSRQGLENEIMLSLTPLNDGRALFSSNCGGVFEWKDGNTTYSEIHNYFESGCNWSVFQDSKDRIWVGGNELYVTDSTIKQGTQLGKEEGYDGYFTYAITESREGEMMVGASEGFYRYDGHRFQKFTMEDGLYDNNVIFIYQDEDGLIWLGTKSGLNVFDNGEIRQVKLQELEEDKEGLTQPAIRAIHEDSDGVLWAGSYGNGLFRLKEGKVTQFTTASGLFDNIVSHIVEDERGFFWMGSNRGISRVDKQELNDYAEGDIEQVSATSFGSDEGMNSAETNGGFQPSTFMDSTGHIYFPTVRGVAVVATRDVDNNSEPPPVGIEMLRNNEGLISLSDSISLPYNTPYLEINYTAINLTNPGKVQFKYRLNGLDETWINVNNRRTAMYSKIPAGEYQFEVTASNDGVNWNTKSASFHLTVVPPFWQTSWFYGLSVLVFLTIGPSLYYYRVSLLRKENEKQKRFSEQLINSQELERKRIASELHDSLGQQILVMKNRVEIVLNKLNETNGIAAELSEIKESAERSIGEVRAISHGLRPVLLEKFGLSEALKNLCAQVKSASSIDWSYYIDETEEVIPKDKEIHFFRVVQEAINNIMKHSMAKEASVIVKKGDDGIMAKIWDDGNGFNAKVMAESKGLGFIGMKERIETLKGTIHIQSEKDKGTVITINIPLANYE